MADGSSMGKGPETPLKQGYGAITWSSDKVQAVHPCFIPSNGYDFFQAVLI